MEIVITHGAGLDVHKRRIVATVLTSAVTETRTFGTLTADLLALADWLTACGVTHVAMEATGVYWKPVYNVLEAVDGLTVWVVNPQTIRGMPGRKSDVQDSQWSASLLRIGALKASVIPPRPQRELRELVRYRQSLVRERGPKPTGSQRSGKARTSSWPASSATFWRSPGRGSCRPCRPGKPTPRRWPASPTRGFEPRTRP